MEFVDVFRGFLVREWGEGSATFLGDLKDHQKCKKSIDYKQALQDAGLGEKKADDLAGMFLSNMGFAEEVAYAEGIRGGAQLMLYLLGIAPGTRP